MNIKLLFFGRARELIKNSSINLDMPDNSTLKELVNIMNDKYPVLTAISIIYSKNNEYMYSLDTIINNGDVIGFIPPISGG